MKGESFYSEILSDLIRKGIMKPTDKILVCCGGEQDKVSLEAAGLVNVVISNLDSRMAGTEYSPYGWSFQDVEKLGYADGEFDFCVEQNGLHHCHSPHRGLLEMHRVARKGVVFLEPYDNAVTRLGVKLGFGQEFEHAAVFFNDLKFGGVANSEIPNFIYRWTRREIVKTIICNAPYGPPKIHCIHKMRIPWGQLRGRKNPLFLWAVRLALPLIWMLERLAPAQCNCFGVVSLKPDLARETYPWLLPDPVRGVKLNSQWLRDRYQQGDPQRK